MGRPRIECYLGGNTPGFGRPGMGVQSIAQLLVAQGITSRDPARSVPGTQRALWAKRIRGSVPKLSQ